jgi:hypothetical protein
MPVGSLTLVPIVLPQDSLPLFTQSQVNLSLGPNINNPVLRPQAIRFALDQLAPNLYTDLPYLTFDNTETIYSSLGVNYAAEANHRYIGNLFTLGLKYKF